MRLLLGLAPQLLLWFTFLELIRSTALPAQGQPGKGTSVNSTCKNGGLCAKNIESFPVVENAKSEMETDIDPMSLETSLLKDKSSNQATAQSTDLIRHPSLSPSLLKRYNDHNYNGPITYFMSYRTFSNLSRALDAEDRLLTKALSIVQTLWEDRLTQYLATRGRIVFKLGMLQLGFYFFPHNWEDVRVVIVDILIRIIHGRRQPGLYQLVLFYDYLRFTVWLYRNPHIE